MDEGNVILWAIWNSVVPRNANRCTSFFFNEKKKYICFTLQQKPRVARKSKATCFAFVEMEADGIRLYLRRNRQKELLWQTQIPLAEPGLFELVTTHVRREFGLRIPAKWYNADRLPPIPASLTR